MWQRQRGADAPRSPGKDRTDRRYFLTLMVGLVVRATPLTVVVRVLAVPTVVAVKTTVYVPSVAVSLTVPNVPTLVPPERLKPKALLLRPLMALPAASLTVMVTRSVLPLTTLDAAKL